MVESSDEEAEHFQYKLIVIGNGAVGKTSIIHRFAQDHFAQSYKQTIGCDFSAKHLVLPGEVNVTLKVWDIGGQQLGGKMIHNYIYGSDAILLVYDITDYQSFQDLEDWYELVKQVYKDGEVPYCALVGNKSDLKHMKQVQPDQHNEFADDNDLNSFFMSAKSGDDVNNSFYKMAADLAGVILSKPQVEVNTKVVKAEIVNHPTDSFGTHSSGPITDPIVRPAREESDEEDAPVQAVHEMSLSQASGPPSNTPASRSGSVQNVAPAPVPAGLAPQVTRKGSTTVDHRPAPRLDTAQAQAANRSGSMSSARGEGAGGPGNQKSNNCTVQ